MAFRHVQQLTECVDASPSPAPLFQRHQNASLAQQAEDSVSGWLWNIAWLMKVGAAKICD
jgi:hypothetical protein